MVHQDRKTPGIIRNHIKTRRVKDGED